MKRRAFIGNLATAASLPSIGAAAETPKTGANRFAGFQTPGPPVIQNPTADAFSVAWKISGKASGWVEWGTTRELGNLARPAHHGLMSMAEHSLSVRVNGIPEDAEVYYRVVTMPVRYRNAYSIEKGAPLHGEIRRLRLPKASAATCSLVMVNDTHDVAETVAALARRVHEIDPDALIWNGDTCNTFDSPEQVARICLSPGQDPADPGAGGWASTRPLFFVPGNHDARGESARTMPECLTPWPHDPADPDGIVTTPVTGGRYCFASRIGPVAIIGLDTGEDKPDAHPAWGGMAAYEPYREAQKKWLVKALKQPAIANAPYLLTFCHIPLRGLPGDNDGMGLEGFAAFSGHGRKLWVDPLVKAGCQMVLSGHTHSHRIDVPGDQCPFHQVVGGGPRANEARLIRIHADDKQLRLIVENLDRQEVAGLTLQPRNV